MKFGLPFLSNRDSISIDILEINHILQLFKVNIKRNNKAKKDKEKNILAREFEEQGRPAEQKRRENHKLKWRSPSVTIFSYVQNKVKSLLEKKGARFHY